MRRRTSVPRLEDVAKRARVHASTVSRFFSNPAVVSADAAARIRAAVAELGYTPNFVAGSLASSSRRLVALLVSDLAFSNFNEVIETITSGLTTAGTHVMLCITGGSPERAEQLIANALSWRVDAVIAWAPIGAGGTRLLRASGVTVLQISDAAATPIDIGIGFDQAAAGKALARFAFDRGYRRPHLVATKGHHSARRSTAFQSEWRRLVKRKASVLLIDTPTGFQHGRRVYAHLAQLDEVADVAICSSDYLAQSLIIEAQAHGLRVPGNLAVIGLGNSPMAGSMRPTITTIDLHTDRIAPETLRILAARGRGEKSPGGHIDLGFSIVARDSA